LASVVLPVLITAARPSAARVVKTFFILFPVDLSLKGRFSMPYEGILKHAKVINLDRICADL
jgi:hypothetical protein